MCLHPKMSIVFASKDVHFKKALNFWDLCGDSALGVFTFKHLTLCQGVGGGISNSTVNI